MTKVKKRGIIKTLLNNLFEPNAYTQGARQWTLAEEGLQRLTSQEIAALDALRLGRRYSFDESHRGW